ncbi:MAG: hypothetical protein MK078_01485 [Crocinitomicaceae bacterium]|nr:hypothetical protein [Crocinitomicaceae bacterium]
MRIFLLSTVLLVFLSSKGQDFNFDLYKNNETHTYESITKGYKGLEKAFPKKCRLIELGSSDIGEPIHLFVINSSGSFQKKDFKGKTILFVNNAIHPGEPCGVDASIKWCRDILNDVPDNIVVGVIPMYNVGGALNRNCCSRANQNGPKMYGFRGNSRNLDLNRDFIKADSKNTLAFYKAFHYLEPHLFVDTHTSNGADYQYVMTLITSQTDKMNPYLAKYTKDEINPVLYSEMENSGFPMVPYVHHIYGTPDDGIMDYLETPRYSTGYTNLFHTISYVSEAHMLKTYEERVEATYSFLDVLYNYATTNAEELRQVKSQAEYSMGQTEKLALDWELDTVRFDEIRFMGYAAKYKKSEVTGKDRLYYDREEPYTKKIKYFNRYIPVDTVEVPALYIVPQAWGEIIELMLVSNIEVMRLTKDKVLETEHYRIREFNTRPNPYEGHYLHTSVEVEKFKKITNWRKGDYVIYTRNKNLRFIVETLEPHAPDSYLAWNYFDAILQQKEWFSAYVFEDEAAQILKDNPQIKDDFEKKKASDSEFEESAFAQLYYLYQKSGHYEPTHNLYPIGRLMTEEIMADEIELVPGVY